MDRLHNGMDQQLLMKEGGETLLITGHYKVLLNRDARQIADEHQPFWSDELVACLDVSAGFASLTPPEDVEEPA